MNQMEKISGGFFTGINYWGLKDATQMWENTTPLPWRRI